MTTRHPGGPRRPPARREVRTVAGRLGAEITLLHVAYVPESFRAAAGVTVDGVVERERRQAESYLRRVARERRAGVTVEVTSTSGVVAERIAHHQARRPGSLAVIGSHGRTGWRDAVIGSVARRVVAFAEGPVLVLHPKAARAS